MDPRFTFRKGYDTDLLILRSLFALDPNTNLPISSFYTGVADGIGGIQWLSPTQYFSAATGILNFVSSVESFSTVTGLYSNFSTQAFSNFYTRSLLTSTVSTFFVSSQNVTVSSLTFMDVTNNAKQILNFSSGNLYKNGSLFYNPETVLTSNLVSTVRGLGTAGYISSSQLLSSISGLSNLYITTPSLVSTTSNLTNNLISTTAGVYRALTSTTGGVYITFAQTSNHITNMDQQTSNWTTNSLVSTTIAVGIPIIAFPSTVAGLGTAGYISSSQLISTVAGLATAGYISSSQLISTVAGLGGAGLVSSGQLLSSVAGLGTAGYISSSQLQSTVIGLGGTGVISTGQLVSTVRGLGTAGYISTSQLVSTTIGLSNLIVPASGASVANLVSTVAGLGESGYISSSQLASTVNQLNANFYVQNASQVFVNNSFLNISSVGTFIYFSTFMNSSITYQGNNGDITASNAAGPTAPFYFSSATLNLDRWSSFINQNSIITVEAYPTFSFANLGLPSANPELIYMSSFIQSGSLFLSSHMAMTGLYPTMYTAFRSNSFYQPMKITVPGSAVQGFYPNSIRLAHYLPNARTVGVTQGFSNNNVSIYFGSTNSLFLSIQNLPL